MKEQWSSYDEQVKHKRIDKIVSFFTSKEDIYGFFDYFFSYSSLDGNNCDNI